MMSKNNIETENTDSLKTFIAEYKRSRLTENATNTYYLFIQILRRVIERRRKYGENIPFLDKKTRQKILTYKRIDINTADRYIAELSEYLLMKEEGLKSEDELMGELYE